MRERRGLARLADKDYLMLVDNLSINPNDTERKAGDVRDAFRALSSVCAHGQDQACRFPFANGMCSIGHCPML